MDELGFDQSALDSRTWAHDHNEEMNNDYGSYADQYSSQDYETEQDDTLIANDVHDLYTNPQDEPSQIIRYQNNCESKDELSYSQRESSDKEVPSEETHDATPIEDRLKGLNSFYDFFIFFSM
jgi:hypothetical protein